MDYRETVITYIDVLGFKQIVEQRGPADIDALLRAFQGHASPFFLAEAYDLSYVAFSDLVVRLSPLRDPSSLEELSDRLTTEMSDIAAAQTLLCQRGIVIRGAITSGKILSHSGRLFGPGLIRAYDLETRVARYPRVILDSSLVDRLGLSPWLDDPAADGEDFEHHVLEPCQYCVRDSDGEVFVDYLGSMCSLGDDSTAEAIAEEGILLEKHRRTIQDGLSSQNERIREKYEWLLSYHNRVVRQGLPNEDVDERSVADRRNA